MQVYIGIDWSEKKHQVHFMNEAGSGLAQLEVAQTPEGYRAFVEKCQQLQLSPSEAIIGLETAHTLFIDFLWDHHFEQVYVLPTRVVKSQQSRFRQSGARNDARDAELIAAILRTDRQHFYPWHPDTRLTRQLRAKISLIDYQTAQIVRTSNRLRSVLLRYYPAALDIFSSLETQIAQAFIQRYPTPAEAAQLAFPEFLTFAQIHHYPQPKKLAQAYARLRQPQLAAHPDVVSAYAKEAQFLATLLTQLVKAKAASVREAAQLFGQHPDAFIYRALPQAGDLLEPALLAILGDDRARFPTPESLQSLVGTCPVTDASGKRKLVKFRRACNKQYRQIVQKWAKATVNQSAWATAYFMRIRPRCASDSHAYRCLANRWLAILWKLWQTRQAYDEGYHLRQLAGRSQPRSQ
jgi:transposase